MGEMCAPPQDPPPAYLPTLLLLHTTAAYYCCILLLHTTATYHCCILLLHTTAAYLLDPQGPPRAHFPPWCILHALLQIGLLKGLKVTMSLRNDKALVLA